MNIYQVFSELHGSKGKALAYINEALGTAYIHSKYSLWEQGKAFPSHVTFHLIYQAVLTHVLDTSDTTSEEKARLAAQLHVPPPEA